MSIIRQISKLCKRGLLKGEKTNVLTIGGPNVLVKQGSQRSSVRDGIGGIDVQMRTTAGVD